MPDIYYPPEEDIIPAILAVPHSREAEESVIGSVIINPLCFYAVNQFLKAHHFYIIRNRWIWEAFITMDERRTAIDLLTIGEELDRRGQLNEIGGPAYLTSLVSNVPTSINVEHYGHIVESHAVRRQMIAAANQIAQYAFNEEMEISDCLQKAKEETTALETVTDGHEFIQLGELFKQTYEDIQVRAESPKEVWGLATGLPRLDRETGGMQLGELVYLPGRPGIGKTWLELGWAMEFGKQEPGAIISMEMRKNAIGRRMLAGVSGVSTRAMKSGFLQSDDFPLMAKAIEDYEGHPVWIDDGSYSSLQLRATLARLKKTHGIRWFIADYALLFTDKGKDEIERSTIISTNMKRIVQDLNIAGIVIHSVNKVGMGSEHEEPEQGEQRGSGQAVFDCDVQLMLTRVYEKDTDLQTVKPVDLQKMATLWCTKGRELEKSKFKVHLVRKGNSPFWGEFAPPRFASRNIPEREDQND